MSTPILPQSAAVRVWQYLSDAGYWLSEMNEHSTYTPRPDSPAEFRVRGNVGPDAEIDPEVVVGADFSYDKPSQYWRDRVATGVVFYVRQSIGINTGLEDEIAATLTAGGFAVAGAGPLAPTRQSIGATVSSLLSRKRALIRVHDAADDGSLSAMSAHIKACNKIDAEIAVLKRSADELDRIRRTLNAFGYCLDSAFEIAHSPAIAAIAEPIAEPEPVAPPVATPAVDPAPAEQPAPAPSYYYATVRVGRGDTIHATPVRADGTFIRYYGAMCGAGESANNTTRRRSSMTIVPTAPAVTCKKCLKKLADKVAPAQILPAINKRGSR